MPTKFSKYYITIEEGTANKFLTNNNSRNQEFKSAVNLIWPNYVQIYTDA